jgi:hypothetical protein
MGIEMVVIRVVTHCATVDAFVASFAKLSTDTSIFVPTQKLRTVGVETGFSIRLADGTPALRGLCVVEGAYVDGDNAYKRPGVLLGIRKLTADSQPVFARLRDPMLPLITTDTVKLSPDEARPTVEMPALFPEAVDCEVTDDPTEAVPTALQEVTVRVPADADRTVKVETERATILGMPPLVPPRKDTEKMSPIERAAIVAAPKLTATSAPIAVIDEETGRIALPFWKRLRAWVARLWQKVSPPAASRAPQAR